MPSGQFQQLSSQSFIRFFRAEQKRSRDIELGLQPNVCLTIVLLSANYPKCLLNSYLLVYLTANLENLEGKHLLVQSRSYCLLVLLVEETTAFYHLKSFVIGRKTLNCRTTRPV